MYKILLNSTLVLLDPSLNRTWNIFPKWQKQFILGVLCDATIGLHPLNLIGKSPFGYKQ